MAASGTDWEAHHRALVRRLVEINDAADTMPTDRRILDYDVLARAHKKTMELYPDDRMIAGVDDDPISSSLG